LKLVDCVDLFSFLKPDPLVKNTFYEDFELPKVERNALPFESYGTPWEYLFCSDPS